MRTLVLVGFALSVLLITPLNFAAEPPLTPTQIARLESLCRVWGTVKFFHPWIVAPPDGKPIDWDAAIISAIPEVEKANTNEEYVAALNQMFSVLNDDATRAIVSRETESQDALTTVTAK